MITKENEDNSTKKSKCDELKEEYQQQQTEEEERLREAQKAEAKAEAENSKEEKEKEEKKDIDDYNKSLENEIFKENSFIRKTITEQEKFEEQQKRERDKAEKEIELRKKAEADYEKIKIRAVKAKIDMEIEKYKKENNPSHNYFKFSNNDFKKEVYFFVKYKTRKDIIYIIENIKNEEFDKYEDDREILEYYEDKVINELLINFYKLEDDEIYSALEDNEEFNEEISRLIKNEKRLQARFKKMKEDLKEKKDREEKERVEREREEQKQRRREQAKAEAERIERENKRFINKLKKIFKLFK
ncbi:TPA: hypothetical protein ACPPHM_001867 [Haemophilus influenzae]